MCVQGQGSTRSARSVIQLRPRNNRERAKPGHDGPLLASIRRQHQDPVVAVVSDVHVPVSVKSDAGRRTHPTTDSGLGSIGSDPIHGLEIADEDGSGRIDCDPVRSVKPGPDSRGNSRCVRCNPNDSLSIGIRDVQISGRIDRDCLRT